MLFLGKRLLHAGLILLGVTLICTNTATASGCF